MPVDKQILADYVATANSGKYKSLAEVNQKFPELKEYDPQLLEDYVATVNSGKYSSLDEVNERFPEFTAEKKKPSLGEQWVQKVGGSVSGPGGLPLKPASPFKSISTSTPTTTIKKEDIDRTYSDLSSLQKQIEPFATAAKANKGKLAPAEFAKYKPLADRYNSLLDKYKGEVSAFNAEQDRQKKERFDAKFAEYSNVGYDPVQRIKTYSTALSNVQNRYKQTVQAYKQAEEAGDEQALAELSPLIKQDSEKAAYFAQAIEGQKKLAALKEDNSFGNNLSIGFQQIANLGLGLKSIDEAMNAFQSGLFTELTGYELRPEVVEKIKKFNEETKGTALNPTTASDVIYSIAKPIVEDAAKRNEARSMNLKYGGSAWEALLNGEPKLAAEYATKSALQSIPSSFLYANPYTAMAATAGQAGEEMNQIHNEGRDVNAKEAFSAFLKASFESVFEQNFGIAKGMKSLVAKFGKEGAEQMVGKAAKDFTMKVLAKKYGKMLTEEEISELATKMSQNTVDKYVLGKDVGIMDGTGDVFLTAGVQSHIQGGPVVVASHFIDKKKAAQHEQLKAKSASLAEQAAEHPSPVVAEAINNEAEKLHTEGDAIAQEQKEIAENASPETIAQIQEGNAKLDELEAGLQDATEETAPIIEANIAQLEQEQEALIQKAREEAVAKLSSLKKSEEVTQLQVGEEVQTEPGTAAESGQVEGDTKPVLKEDKVEVDAIDQGEIIRRMQPITDEMAKIEMELGNRGVSIRPDYDGEVLVTDSNTGEMLEPDELGKDALDLVAKYEAVTAKLSEFDDSSMKRALDESRKRIMPEAVEAVDVTNEIGESSNKVAEKTLEEEKLENKVETSKRETLDEVVKTKKQKKKKKWKWKVGAVDATKDSIRKFFDTAAKTKDTVIPLFVRKVSPAEVETIKAKTGIEIDTNYSHIIDNSGINHTLNEHSDPIIEESRGQIPIVREDFERIPEIIDSYDTIEAGGKAKGTEPQVIVYSKRFTDGVTYYLEEVRTGEEDLALKSMWKKKNTGDSGGLIGIKPDPQTAEPTPDRPDAGDKGNGGFENTQIKNESIVTEPDSQKENATLSTLEEKIDRLNKLKIDTKGTLGAFGIAPAIWNAGIDTIILAIRAGKSFADAIKEGVAYLKKEAPEVDENELTNYFKNELGDEPVQGNNLDANPEQKNIEPKEVETLSDDSETGVEVQQGSPKDEAMGASDESDVVEKRRRFTKQFIKQFPHLEPSLKDDVKNYQVLPNKVSREEAMGIIESLGDYEARKAFSDLNNGMPEAVRMTIGQILIKRLEDSGKTDEAIDLLEEITKRATDLGQGIQALSMFQLLSPQGQIRVAQREINKARARRAKRDKPKTDKLKSDLKKANQESVDEVLNKPEVKGALGKSGEIKPAPTVEPRTYGQSNKIVSKSAYEQAKKALRGKFFTAVIPPELIVVGAYHLEAGSRSFADFSKKMVKDFGAKVKPYLRGIYSAAKEKFAGASFESEFESEDALNLLDVEKNLTDGIKSGLADLGQTIEDIVRQHYTVADGVKQTLKEKLIEKAGLTGAEADRLSRLIESEFDKIATAKKKQILSNLFRGNKRTSREVKTLEQKLIELTNLGAFSESSVLNTWAESMGYPTLSDKEIKEIQRLAHEVEMATGTFKKNRAIEDLLAYQANIKGVSKTDLIQSIWYANILSGFTTQEVNFVANILNSLALYVNAIAQNPKQAGFIGLGFIEGLKRGWLEGKETLKTGYSPIRGKVDIPSVLERHKFTGWGKVLNWHKYVLRTMKASDVLVYEGLKEMRAYQLAVKLAARDTSLEPSQKIRNRAAEILSLSMVEYATEQSKSEYELEVESINNSPLSPTEKAKKLSQAKVDQQRRIFEIMEELKPESVQLESEMYAARGTYNYKPEGILGLISLALNQAKESLIRASENADNKIVKYSADAARLIVSSIVPFTNIIANVANESLNYSPVGLLGAAAGRSALTYNGQELTPQQRVDLMTKALIGTSAAAAIFALATIPAGDDDEPLIEITANGFGDYRKNYDLQKSGWQPYSIKVNGKWYSYQYSPLIILFSLIGNIKDYEKYRGEKMTDNGLITKVSAAFGYTFKTLMDMSFLSSLNSFLSAAVDPRNEDRLNDLMKSSAKTVQSIAMPNLYTQLAKEVEKIFSIPTKDVRNSWFGQTLQHVPVARNKYYDKLNSLGETIAPDTDKFISSESGDKVWNLIYDKSMSIGSPSIKTISIYDPVSKSTRALTEQEFFDLSKSRGSYIKKEIEKNFDQVNAMTPEGARDWIKDVKAEATKAAKKELFYVNLKKAGIPEAQIQNMKDRDERVNAEREESEKRNAEDQVENDKKLKITDEEKALRSLKSEERKPIVIEAANKIESKVGKRKYINRLYDVEALSEGEYDYLYEVLKLD